MDAEGTTATRGLAPEGHPASDVDGVLPRKTRADLEWSRLLTALAARCDTPMGRGLALDLSPAETVAEAQTALVEAEEAYRSGEHGEPLPIASLGEGRADVREAHARVAHGGVLGPHELLAVAAVLGAARTLRRFLHARREAMPALFARAATDPTLDRLEDSIRESFDEAGTLADHASPELRALRAEHGASRARMISRIEELMRRYAHVLRDSFWTEREGRYVLPVRNDAHERFPGIVHASSSSGATLFVEPRVLVPLGNRLKVLEGDVRREEERIYASLTARVAESLPSVGAAIDAVAIADLRAASARFARDLRLNFPERSEHAAASFSADLLGLRHPLLALDHLEGHGPAVVPSDIRVAAGQALIVSGPNAGGKTVALKALGFAAAMLRSGLPIPAKEGSRLGLVEVVLSDVGDDQSLQKSLSTFSAHVVNLAHLLDEARPGALVLLDELAGGTDPREGEALAAAVLDGLCRRGAAVVATTHYEGLKALALGDPRFANASVGFDTTTLMPTFQLAIGVPGASSALAVARRFGIPSLVIERAEAYLGGAHRSFEDTVRALNDERRALELARAAAEDDREKAQALREELEDELARARARDRRAMEKEAEALLSSLRRARDDLRAAQARLRTKKPDAEGLREADKLLDAVASKVAIGGELAELVSEDRGPEREPSEPQGPLPKGTKVWLSRLRTQAEVIELVSDTQVRVSAGALKLTVARADLRVLAAPRDDARGVLRQGRASLPRLRSSHGNASAEPARDSLPAFEGAESLPALQTSENTCDLRGLRVDDAWPMLETFLDRALHDNQRVAFVVHGHGSGAIRDHVREQLSKSRYVARFRPGHTGEGGDGVTVVWLS